jgi:hypothetical protein
LIGLDKKKSAGREEGVHHNRIGDFGSARRAARLRSLRDHRFPGDRARLSPRPRDGVGASLIAFCCSKATGKFAQIRCLCGCRTRWRADSVRPHPRDDDGDGRRYDRRNAVLFGHAPQTYHRSDRGVATALMASTIGLVQNDIKRVLCINGVPARLHVSPWAWAPAAGISASSRTRFQGAAVPIGRGIAACRRAGFATHGRLQSAASHMLDISRGAGGVAPGLAGFFSGRHLVPHRRADPPAVGCWAAHPL